MCCWSVTAGDVEGFGELLQLWGQSFPGEVPVTF